MRYLWHVLEGKLFLIIQERLSNEQLLRSKKNWHTKSNQSPFAGSKEETRIWNKSATTLNHFFNVTFIHSNVFQLGFHFNFHLFRHSLSLVSVNTILFPFFHKVSHFACCVLWIVIFRAHELITPFVRDSNNKFPMLYRKYTPNIEICGGWFLTKIENKMQWMYTNHLYCAIRRKCKTYNQTTNMYKYKVYAIFHALVEILYTIFSGYGLNIKFLLFPWWRYFTVHRTTHNKLEKFDLC